MRRFDVDGLFKFRLRADIDSDLIAINCYETVIINTKIHIRSSHKDAVAIAVPRNTLKCV